MNQAVVIDTKTANSLIEAILGLKSEVAFLSQKIMSSEDSFDVSTNMAIEDLKDGRVVEFTDIDKAIKYLHT